MNLGTINLGAVDTGYVTADECNFGYTFVNGECLPVPMTAPPVYAPQPLPPVSIPAQTYPSPAAACPNGMTLYDNAVCLPDSSPTIQQQTRSAVSSTIIPGVPNWMLYSIGGVMALMLFKGRR